MDKVTKSWKVYGENGHRQRISFGKSFEYDLTGKFGRGVMLLKVDCSDKTGTNDYVIVTITANTADECEREFHGQIYDGIFENSRVGKIEEI